MSDTCIGGLARTAAPRRGRLPGQKRRGASGGAAHKLPASLASKPSAQVCRVRECVLPLGAVKPRRGHSLVLSFPESIPQTGL